MTLLNLTALVLPREEAWWARRGLLTARTHVGTARLPCAEPKVGFLRSALTFCAQHAPPGDQSPAGFPREMVCHRGGCSPKDSCSDLVSSLTTAPSPPSLWFVQACALSGLSVVKASAFCSGSIQRGPHCLCPRPVISPAVSSGGSSNIRASCKVPTG